MARPWHRWLPAGAVTAIIVGTVAVTSQAGATDLPDKSAEDVLAMLGEQSVTAYSGSFEQSADLGLPALPAGLGAGGSYDGHGFGAAADDADVPGDLPDGASSSDTPAADEDATAELAEALELLTGDHSGRVYVAGPDQARVQILDNLAERDVVINNRDVWRYDSAANTVTHLTLPDPADLPDLPEHLATEHAGTVPTPEELAADAVEALKPSTELTVGPAELVAGRAAYTLTLTPRAEETLVGQVSIAVDGETGFPLGVTINARGQSDPAFRVEYTEISFTAPDAALFDFTPPAEATVEEYDVPVPELPEDLADLPTHSADGYGSAGGLEAVPEVLGEGWAAVAVIPAGPDALGDQQMLDDVTEQVSGGRLLSTALVNVLITDDGRVLLGAVTSDHLQELATQ